MGKKRKKKLALQYAFLGNKYGDDFKENTPKYIEEYNELTNFIYNSIPTDGATAQEIKDNYEAICLKAEEYGFKGEDVIIEEEDIGDPFSGCKCSGTETETFVWVMVEK